MTDLQTSLKRINKAISDKIPRFGISPESDWKIISVSTVLLAILVVILSVFVFIKIDKGEIFLTEKTVGFQEKAVDPKILNQTVDYYEAKAALFDEVLREGTGVPDPSF